MSRLAHRLLQAGTVFAQAVRFIKPNLRGTMIKHQGGCHCGQVRFSTEYDPLLVFQCNCMRCRRMTGMATVAVVYGDQEAEISGTTKEYTTPGGSGMPVHYHFCPDCGSRVYFAAEVLDGFIGFSLGTFDDSLAFEPESEIFTNYKMKWIRDDGCIKESFEEAAVLERIQALMKNLDQRA